MNLEREVIRKNCKTCEDYLPATLENFYFAKGNKFNLTSSCKDCVNIVNAKKKAYANKRNGSHECTLNGIDELYC